MINRIKEKWPSFKWKVVGFIIGVVLCCLLICRLNIQSIVASLIFAIATGTLGSAISSLFVEKDQPKVKRKRQVIIAVISGVAIIISQAFAYAEARSGADSPSPSPPSSPSPSQEPEPPVPTPTPTPAPADDEIRTAISFSTPGQIENEVSPSFELQLDPLLLQEILILSTSFRSEIVNPDEYYNKAKAYIQEYLTGFAHINPNCPSEELNGNPSLIRLLEEANEINLEIKIKRSVALYLELMLKYEEAYAIAKSSTISLQLARPYAEIVEVYPRETLQQCQEIFRYGVLGIQYYLETLSYEVVFSESDGDLLYRIGQVYHYLGDVPGVPLEIRQELYLIASIYLDLATEWGADDYEGFSAHYAGMVNHKLGVISGEENYSYLLRATDRYQLALYSKEHFSDTLIGDIHKFYGDVYERLSNYVLRYGSGSNLATSEDYSTLAKEQYEAYAFYNAHS